MPRSRRTIALLATLAIAASPAAALAQSAGDDQYEDPFGDEAPQEAPAAPAPTPAPAPAPAAPAPSGGAPEAQSSAADPAPAPSTAVAAQDQLPRTGADAEWLALGGVALIAAGAGIRLRIRPRDGVQPG